MTANSASQRSPRCDAMMSNILVYDRKEINVSFAGTTKSDIIKKMMKNAKNHCEVVFQSDVVHLHQ